MSARTATILGRFPRHLDLDRPGKRIGAVVDALAADLDTQTGQLGDIRRSHRSTGPPTTTDLLRLAGLHGLGGAALEIVDRRMAAITTTGTATTGTATRIEGRLAAQRAVVAGIIAGGLTGNGTPGGLLRATAAYLGLSVTDVEHTADRWWHLAAATDTLAGTAGSAGTRDLLALEENPRRPADVGPDPRRHGERFAVVRGGIDAVPVTVAVRGVGDRTRAPMVVNRDTGSGVAYERAVPDGSELRFHADGRVELDGAAVGRWASSFRGSVFADEAAPVATDFVFAADDDGRTEPPVPHDAALADHTAFYAVSAPVDDVLATDAAFPHADGLVEPVSLARGRTRWSVFVGDGSFAGDAGSGQPLLPAPRFEAALFDRTVFAPDPAGEPSMELTLEWEEPEAFAVRIWIPQRFAALDAPAPDAPAPGDPGGAAAPVPVRERLRTLLDRHRAVGVRLTVEYADPRWTLGTGVLRGLGPDSPGLDSPGPDSPGPDSPGPDPRGLVVTGTSTWPANTPQPSPSER